MQGTFIIDGRKVKLTLDLGSDVAAKQPSPIGCHYVTNYIDCPSIGLTWEDKRLRKTRWVRNIIWHTTKGIAPKVKPDFGKSTNLDDRIARLWATDKRYAGAHLSVDHDGAIGCHADLVSEATYHAGSINDTSVGIELYQGSDGGLYEGQLRVAVELTEWLCCCFGIQRQMQLISTDGVFDRAVQGGKDLVGVFGHRHVTTNRGPGDPGDSIFEALHKVGFTQFDFVILDDLVFWRRVQTNLKIKPDGIPGPVTVDALEAAGYRDGLYAFPEMLGRPLLGVDIDT